MNYNTELEQIAKEIQNECHETVMAIIDHPDFKRPADIHDARMIFLFRKLAEQELRLRQLELRQDNIRYNSSIH